MDINDTKVMTRLFAEKDYVLRAQLVSLSFPLSDVYLLTFLTACHYRNIMVTAVKEQNRESRRGLFVVNDYFPSFCCFAYYHCLSFFSYWSTCLHIHALPLLFGYRSSDQLTCLYGLTNSLCFYTAILLKICLHEMMELIYVWFLVSGHWWETVDKVHLIMLDISMRQKWWKHIISAVTLAKREVLEKR